ncbi:hypothetical protein RI367_008016 [Sorochytrium milnesiophthora]
MSKRQVEIRRPNRCKRITVTLVVFVVLVAIAVGSLFATGKIHVGNSSSSTSGEAAGAAPAGGSSPSGNSNAPSGSGNGGPSKDNSTLVVGGFLRRKVTPSDKGMIFGAHIWGDKLDWSPASPAAYNGLLGRSAAGFGAFVSADSATGIVQPERIAAWANQVQTTKGYLMLTLEPTTGGLPMMTDDVCGKVADILANVNGMGVPVLLRFAHEMNGNWYPWAQKPALYKTTWVRLATAVKAKANLTSLVWSPNEPSGYPWQGQEAAQPGSADYKAMDTNNDGKVDGLDDPYTPYWPGAEYVDWVGISTFHFGPYPFGRNVLPDTGRPTQLVTGAGSDIKWSIAKHAQQQQRPLGVFEAGAMYYPQDTSAGAATNEQIKRAWLSQLLGGDLYQAGVRLIMWFEVIKTEGDGNGQVQVRDSALLHDDTVRKGVLQDLAGYKVVGSDNV